MKPPAPWGAVLEGCLCTHCSCGLAGRWVGRELCRAVPTQDIFTQDIITFLAPGWCLDE